MLNSIYDVVLNCHCSVSGPDLICKWAESNKTSSGQYKKSKELKDLNLSHLNAMDCDKT